MNRAGFPSLALGKNLSCFFQLLVANNIPCGCITPSSAHLHMTFSFVSFSFSVCLTRKPVSGFGAHMDNPENFPGGATVKNPPANAGDMRDTGLIPGLGRSPGIGSGNPFLYSCLENSMDREAWQATVHGVTENETELSR